MKKILLPIVLVIVIFPGISQGADLFYPYVVFPTGSWPEAVAIGDVNGDGRNDVVTTTSFYADRENDNRLFVFLQNTSGKLDPPMRYPAGNADSVDVGDLNNDVRTLLSKLDQTQLILLAFRNQIAASLTLLAMTPTSCYCLGCHCEQSEAIS